MRVNNRIKSQYLEELEQDCQSGLAKTSTLTQRKKAVNSFFTFINDKNINVKNLNSLDLQNFLQYLSRKESSRGKKYASSTIKQIYTLVKSFYVRCYEKGITTKHPDLIFIRNLLQRYKLEERKLPKYIDQTKMIQLLDECPNRWKALLHFMYDTGARISEVLNVQYHHLDLSKALVQIYEPKTMNVRITSLSETTIQLLKEYSVKYRPEPRAKYTSFVFINQQKRKMTARAIQYLMRRLSGAILGSENVITPHYFRAACAVHLLEDGVDIRQVQEIIGWKSLSVVQYYTRVTPQRQVELKKLHHPGFRLQNRKQPVSKEQPQIMTEEPKVLQNSSVENQKYYQPFLKELRELKKQNLTYEQQIAELIKSQQRLIELLAQEKLINR